MVKKSPPQDTKPLPPFENKRVHPPLHHPTINNNVKIQADRENGLVILSEPGDPAGEEARMLVNNHHLPTDQGVMMVCAHGKARTLKEIDFEVLVDAINSMPEKFHTLVLAVCGGGHAYWIDDNTPDSLAVRLLPRLQHVKNILAFTFDVVTRRDGIILLYPPASNTPIAQFSLNELLENRTDRKIDISGVIETAIVWIGATADDIFKDTFE